MVFYFNKPNFADNIATLCFDFYEKLPKTGKPNSEEWTVLSCIIKSTGENHESLEVVSLGTGSKCIGRNKLSSSGDILNDSHAEVMARRGFLRYLYDQMESACKSTQSIFLKDDTGTFSLLPNIHFHFFSSHLPCGDAAILKQTDESLLQNTGAKCIDTGLDVSEDCSNPILGQVRKKPGRGDPTLSISCSDKLARWIRLGLQGALIDMLLKEPITVQTIIIANDNPSCGISLHRALISRSSDETTTTLDNISPIVTPTLLQSSKAFAHGKELSKEPCPSSIVWCNVKKRPLEAAVEGKKQGVTKKNASSDKCFMMISKKGLFNKFLSVSNQVSASSKVNVMKKQLNSNDTSYLKIKRKSDRYYNKWNIIKNSFFKVWCEKPDQDFFL
ncbi:adenosine deaminase, tRNA-specific 1 [Arctopsyche grandis]|uniref:adenosine deaminase, tRNA-specific 1 n=1 Tax=Arctopsyche grandis TaxID=121162 RepID=UPI00406D7066